MARLSNVSLIPFPSSATSNAPCGFTAVRVPGRLARKYNTRVIKLTLN